MDPFDLDEDFLHTDSKVVQLQRMLEDLNAAGKSDADTIKKPGIQKAEITEDDFILEQNFNRPLFEIMNDREPPSDENAPRMFSFTFMKQMEEDDEKRTKVREETIKLAQKFRRYGNFAYRKQNYEKAVLMYTKAIEFIKDSPILYNNRAITYIKLRNYKRAMMDVDHVILTLEEKNLKSWLYRAIAFSRLGDDKNYQESIKFAKKHNPKEVEYIDSFQEKIREV